MNPSISVIIRLVDCNCEQDLIQGDLKMVSDASKKKVAQKKATAAAKRGGKAAAAASCTRILCSHP
ncbi:hypothetical protein Bca52824_057213 [Brassica carinata]|uniref:Uncharacterized protein n=1 Tax=Brassica carinata TaxID=52824 RepID=A0A8X7QQP8_BRACI|nr:hypothetical protein Bca52824_057213 [Brassica carinata]